jgi:bla regulator protein BlaR1
MIPAYLSPLANHLWQSTLFAAVVALLTLAFRRHRAAVRYGLWLAASVKFLIPLSLLIALGVQFGGQFGWRTATVITRSRVPFAIEQISQPFAPPALAVRPVPTPATPRRVPFFLFSVWMGGFLINLFAWFRDLRRLRATVRAASPLPLDWPIPLHIPVMSTAAHLEPGVLGIRRPVLLLPEGITRKLTPGQLESIVAHEMCHVRRRDNLAAAIHMVVEALFWFHPLVWWIESRLVEERERACDEAVLLEVPGASRDPEVYAEGILTVCKFCLASPLVCVSGVSGGPGAHLKRRIEAIMRHREARNLKSGGKLLLAAAGLAALAAPVFMGVMNAPPARAQEAPGAPLAFEVASVKPNKSGQRSMGSRILPGGHYTANNVPLYRLIAEAYRVPLQSSRISGGPEWLRSENYDIEAKAEAGAFPAGATAAVREAGMMLMLQTLLADRFKLAIRRETKELPVYALVVARNGPKLQKATIEEKDCVEIPADKSIPCHMFNGGQGRGLHGDAVDMSDLVLFVENWSDRPMIDKTGIKGLYNIQTAGWTPLLPRQGQGTPGPGEEDLADPIRPTLFMIMDRLGLKLEAQKAPVDRFLIEHIERPAGN